MAEYEQLQSEIEDLKLEMSSPGGDGQKVQNA
jgi:hypothetical protein